MSQMVLQIKDEALWRMSTPELNLRLAEICDASMGQIKTSAQLHELRVINQIFRARGLR